MRGLVALLLSGLLSAGCASDGEGGGGEPSGSSPVETFSTSPSECRPGPRVLVESGSFFFEPGRIVVCRGQRLLIENTSDVRHDFTVEGPTSRQGQPIRWVIEPGRDVETEVISTLVDPGIYPVECERHSISNPLTQPVLLEIVAS